MSSTHGTPKEEQIQYIGVSELHPTEQDAVQKLSQEYYHKIKRALNNLTNLIVHVKCYQHEGGKKKYSLHVRVDAPTKQNFVSCNADDWDLPRALHKGFQDIEHQLTHKLHTDVTRPR